MKYLIAALLVLVCAQLCLSQTACNNRLANSVMPAGFCPFILVSGLSYPRQLQVVENGDILVVEGGRGQVTVIYDSNNDGIYEKSLLAAASGLNHAVVSHKGFLYASSMSTVYRWPYKVGVRTNLGNPTVVVKNIPGVTDHVTRTLVFDAQDRLYVQQGSSANIDHDISHSVIHRFANVSVVPSGGFDWPTGELFAYGLRNEVGLRFDNQQRLWGVENGLDDLYRADLGGDIHTNNPSEELNLFNTSTPGLFYGYPWCWSQYNLTINHGKPIGSQWAFPDFMPKVTDDWCDNDANVVKPKLNMQAHYAPLDINFYYGKQWPSTYQNDAFVSSHGSWDRVPAVGYRVLHVSFENGMPVKYEPFLSYVGPGETGNNWQRPVSIAFTSCKGYTDCMLVTSDATGIIIAIGYSS